MNSVNLIPGDARGGPRSPSGFSFGPSHAILGVLAVAVGLMVLYVLAGNSISQRKAQLAAVQAQVAQVQAASAHLANYAQFQQLAQGRVATVRQIATTRFDWHRALAELSKVVPSDTSLQSLTGTVSSTSTTGGASSGGGGNSSGLRGAEPGPAFQITGCTKTQDDVARLISRLRVINGVTRVTLSDTQKEAGSASSGTASTSSSGSASGGCGKNTPNFDLVVFFVPVPGAVTSSSTTGAPGAPTTTTPGSTITPGSTTSTTTPGTTTTTPGTTATSQSVSATSPGAGTP
jgi:Tfp pilus assembly protein PilN